MPVIDTIARGIKMKPDMLLRESLKVYLQKKIYNVEAELFLLFKKYGIKKSSDLDKKIRKGLINEETGYNDYFLLDNMETEKQKLYKLLSKLV